MREFTLKELAEKVGGSIVGDETTIITTALPIQEAGEGAITFLSNKKYARHLADTAADAVILANQAQTSAKAQLITDDPYYAFCVIVEHMFGHRKHREASISARAVISETAKVGAGCTVYENVFVDDEVVIGAGCVLYPGVFVGRKTKIGAGCILYPNVVVYDSCTLGDRVILQGNCTVGQDGFGFASHNGVHHKIPHICSVILEDDVEIGSNASIERGSMRDTVIGRGSKIGDSVVIGHGAILGQGCLLVPQVGIAGTAELGMYCVLGGQSAVAGHIKVGNMVMVGGKSAIINDVPDGKRLLGQPAIDEMDAKKMYVSMMHIHDMRKQIRQLERQLKKLEEKGC